MYYSTRKTVKGALIAALYVVLTIISSTFGLSSGPIQLRLSEMLCILPIYSSAAVPGLFIGCIISNLISGSVTLDIIFGSIATLLGALGTYYLKNHKPFICCIPPIFFNSLIVPVVIIKAYNVEMAAGLVFLGVLVGEILSCGLLGLLLASVIKKYKLDNYLRD